MNAPVAIYSQMTAPLYKTVELIEDQVQLEHHLNNFNKWASDWGMVFNPWQCYIMTVNRSQSHRPYLYELCGTILQPVDNEKYFGIKLTSGLWWSLHINFSTKANQNLGFRKRNLKRHPHDLKKLVYIAFLKSGQDKVKRFQWRAGLWFCNRLFRDVSATSLPTVEFLEECRRTCRLTFMYKILTEHVAVFGFKYQTCSRGCDQ